MLVEADDEPTWDSDIDLELRTRWGGGGGRDDGGKSSECFAEAVERCARCESRV